MAFPVIASLLAVSLSFSQASEPAPNPAERIRHWGFEGEIQPKQPGGWRFRPAAARLDREVRASGEASLRLARDGTGPGPIESAGVRIELSGVSGPVTLRAMLRTESADEGAFMWIQQRNGQDSVGFRNTQHNPVIGDTEWHLNELVLEGAPEATHLIVGIGIAGTGTVWIDDVEVLIDGVSQRPVATPLNLDREFVDGSGISADHLTPLQTANLVILAKVWGFLKYHHPAVTRGDYHWDFELFRILPDVLVSETVDEANRRITAWIEGLGEVPPCDPCAAPPRNVQLAADIGWINDEVAFGAELVSVLNHVHANRIAASPQFYLGLEAPGKAAHYNEPSYSQMRFPDAGYRLLSVMRYWNIVEYTFPYRDQISRDWDAVLADYLAEIVITTDADAYGLVMMRLISEIDDSHAGLAGRYDLRPPAGACNIPVGLRFVDGQLIVAGYKHDVIGRASGLEIGDVIRSIDDVSVDQLVEQRRPFYPASTDWARDARMAHLMMRGACGSVALEIESDGEIHSLRAERQDGEAAEASFQSLIRDRAGETFQWLEDGVGYLKLSSVSTDEIQGYVEQIREADALVIDIRNYPGAYIVFDLSRWFAEEETPFARFTVLDVANPGNFVWVDGASIRPVEPAERLDLPVAVLIDDSSMSLAEFTAMAFQALPHVTLVGSPTVGADGDVVGFALPGGLQSRFSGLGVFYPDGGVTQRVGIIPDIEVYPTIEGIRAGRDEVLEAALEHLAAAREN